MTIRILLTALVLVAVALPAGAQVRPATAAHLSSGVDATHPLTRPPGAFPQGLGPYRVGRQTFAYVDFERENRLLVMDAWYPVDAADVGDEPLSFYDLVFTTLDSEVALNAPPVSSDGPFPLVVFSHGSQGIRFQSFFLTEALASHGFIVVAPDHQGNTAQDLVFDTLQPFEANVVNRPIDIGFTIDRMLERNADADDAFAGRIDEQRIGAMGHSFGGYTALAAASGIDGVAADTRLVALAPFAPASSILTDAQLQAITVPTLILGGTADITTPVDDQSTRPFALLSSPERTQIDLIDAGHQSFTNICVFTDTLLDAGIDEDFVAFLLGNAAEGCAPELMPIEQAHALTNLYIVSFMKTFVAGDTRYARYLTPTFTEGKHLPADVYVPEP